MIDIKEKIMKNSVWACLIIFIILLLAHSTEAIFIRMDETFFGENFINKIFGVRTEAVNNSIRYVEYKKLYQVDSDLVY